MRTQGPRFKKVSLPPNGLHFHRCFSCDEYPELIGDVVLLARFASAQFEWGFCKSCVDELVSVFAGPISEQP